MYGYCPGYDDELADIGPGEGVCPDCYIAEVRARAPGVEKTLKTALEAWK
jgi:hypothetical protein